MKLIIVNYDNFPLLVTIYNIPEHDIQAELNYVIGDDDKSLLTIPRTVDCM